MPDTATKMVALPRASLRRRLMFACVPAPTQDGKPVPHCIAAFWVSKQRLKSRICKVAVVCECSVESEAAHHGEGEFIHQARCAGVPAHVFDPRFVPV